jgi:PelA/Pel-15E family pectate lyase
MIAVVLLISSAAFGYSSISKYQDRPEEFYRTDEAKKLAENVLTWQAESGAWPKNTETAAKPYEGDPKKLSGTFDNGATTFELRYLAKMATATKEKRYADAFLKGLNHILEAQYANGGWPQYYPSGNGYARYITFNDGSMARLMFLVRDVAKDQTYAFVPSELREKCEKAWERGIDCILKCQVKVDGKLTSWCAQHDEKDFSPQTARTYELPSLSGSESIGLLHVLMAVEKPSPEIVKAVDAAKEWFEAVKIQGIKVEDRKQEGTPRGYERFVVKDPSAPPMWARFYELGTNKPMFSDRDGVVKYDLSEIGIERRTGYKWLGYWPKNFLEKEYPEWKKKVGEGT